MYIIGSIIGRRSDTVPADKAKMEIAYGVLIFFRSYPLRRSTLKARASDTRTRSTMSNKCRSIVVVFSVSERSFNKCRVFKKEVIFSKIYKEDKGSSIKIYKNLVFHFSYLIGLFVLKNTHQSAFWLLGNWRQEGRKLNENTISLQ